MIRLFVGYDEREAVGSSTFVDSVLRRCSTQVSITPLSGLQYNGSNSFTYARYLIPSYCRYNGWAIFADGADMVCLADLAELWDRRDDRYAVQVAQHEYQTNNSRKYIGTKMESPNIDYPRKNWSSLMLVNCMHRRAYQSNLVPKLGMHQFDWLKDEDIGALPLEWNWLVDEFGPNPEAKILHWTQGIPAFPHYRDAPMAEVWREAHRQSQQGVEGA